MAGSAVGFYGHTGDDVVSEDSGPGEGYLAELNQAWEGVFEPAVREGIRVVWGRTGIVLAPDGGALESLLPIARAAAYGPIGSGKQGVPWIHIDDMVDAITFAITTPKAHGPINLVGHQSTSQRAFASALGRAVRRPAIAPAPSFAMRLLLGEAASALLEGQYVRPDRLQELGFKHRFRDLDDAFRDILSTDRVHIRSLNQTPDVNEGASYLRSAPPTHELTSARVVPQPLRPSGRSSQTLKPGQSLSDERGHDHGRRSLFGVSRCSILPPPIDGSTGNAVGR